MIHLINLRKDNISSQLYLLVRKSCENSNFVNICIGYLSEITLSPNHLYFLSSKGGCLAIILHIFQAVYILIKWLFYVALSYILFFMI